MKDLENSLSVLKVLTEALTVPRSLDEGLDHITRMTCQLMETTQAVFLFREEERQGLLVRSAMGIDLPVGSFLQVPARLKSILWRLQNQHQMNWVESGIEQILFPILVAPISVKGVRVGLLITGGSKDSSRFDSVQQKLFSLLVPFASLVIENAKMNDLLQQRFAIHPEKISQDEHFSQDPARQLTITSINNPAKVIRMLAESFYKELIRAGFRDEHIAIAASQILDCVMKDE